MPEELLYSFTLYGGLPEAPKDPEESVEHEKELRQIYDTDKLGNTSCALCKATFSNLDDQRQHIRSDFHNYNLKLQMKGQPVVDEKTFVRFIGDLDESISGSDTSESEDEDEQEHKSGNTTLVAFLKRQARLVTKQDPTEASLGRKVKGGGNAPIIWLKSPNIPEGNVLGIYKAILRNKDQEEVQLHLQDVLKQQQLSPITAKHAGQINGSDSAIDHSPHVFLCMIGGGHFAAMIVALAPEMRRGQGGIEERHVAVMAHKTFHRYTTRRKQGGSQSANDNAKGNAHSAGSSIRRYNEAALEQDVRNVLSEWRTSIESAKLLFIRATGQQNRRTLFGPYEGQVLRSNDQRLRGFPFSTRRATQTELMRSFTELTRLKVSTITEPEINGDTAEAVAPPKPKATIPKPQPPELSKEEAAGIIHTNQIQALIHRSKVPAVMLYLSKNDLSPDFAFFPANENHRSPTVLHLAASSGSPLLVSSLLLKAKADPTGKNGDGRTPFDVCNDTKTRDAFRVARHTLGESAWDWSAAHVPGGISQEEADARSQQDVAASNAAERERRQADLVKIAAAEEQRNVNRIEKKAGTGKTLAAALEKTGAEKREEEARGLTPETKMKIERERRARAAEERMKKLQAGKRSFDI